MWVRFLCDSVWFTSRHQRTFLFVRSLIISERKVWKVNVRFSFYCHVETSKNITKFFLILDIARIGGVVVVSPSKPYYIYYRWFKQRSVRWITVGYFTMFWTRVPKSEYTRTFFENKIYLCKTGIRTHDPRMESRGSISH